MYKETPHAKQGDLGSNLPVDEAAVEWTVGQEVNVAWTIQVTFRLIFMKVSNCFLSLLFQANHGGGYQYRLCPKGQPLTEVFSTSSLTSSSISPDQKYPPFPIIPIQECFQKLPLPFTGLQGFHWGDGVKVGLICTLLLAVIDL